MSHPPRMGPPIGASNMGMLRIDIRRPSRQGPASRVKIMNPSGNSIPPPMPCTIRKRISDTMFHASAHSSEPRVNATTEPMNSRLVPNRSAAQPVTGITVAKARV